MADRRGSDVFVQVLEGKVRAVGGFDGAVTFTDCPDVDIVGAYIR